MIRVEYINTKKQFIQLYETLKNENAFYFRGQENECWPLRNALHRLKLDRKKKDLPLPNEMKMIGEFMDRLKSKCTGRNLWDVIGAMQHYGIPTRMMDFTESFLIASFFACTEASFSSCSGRFNSIVFAVNRKIPKSGSPDVSLSDLAEFSKEKEVDISYALFVHRMVKPVPRVRIQGGVFLFMHNPYIELAAKLSIENNWFVMRKEKGIYDIEEQWARSTGLLLIQFSLPAPEFLRIKEFLKSENIDDEHLFPDAQGKIRGISNRI
ncbi:MAG: FRG domain-containing protein [Spirochaetia bacterium]|nr:FRG domain-containing protein [Spirochaetia bacterium]